MSKDIGIFFTINFNVLLILYHSRFLFTSFDPGLVDSPPTSTNEAPVLYKLIAWLTPLFFLLNFPPSEKPEDDDDKSSALGAMGLKPKIVH